MEQEEIEEFNSPENQLNLREIMENQQWNQDNVSPAETMLQINSNPEGMTKNKSAVFDYTQIKLQKLKSGVSSTMVKAMISDVLEDNESETKQSSSIFTALFREKMEWSGNSGTTDPTIKKSGGNQPGEQQNQECFYDCIEFPVNFKKDGGNLQRNESHKLIGQNNNEFQFNQTSKKDNFVDFQFEEDESIDQMHPFSQNEEQSSLLSGGGLNNSELIRENIKQIIDSGSQSCDYIAGSTFGTNNNNSNYINEFFDVKPSDSKSRPLPFAQQSQFVVGFSQLPVNPNLIQLNDQAFYKYKEKDMQRALGMGTLQSNTAYLPGKNDPAMQNAANNKSSKQENQKNQSKQQKKNNAQNNWNSSNTEKYKVDYPLQAYIQQQQKQINKQNKRNKNTDQNSNSGGTSSACGKSSSSSGHGHRGKHKNKGQTKLKIQIPQNKRDLINDIQINAQELEIASSHSYPNHHSIKNHLESPASDSQNSQNSQVSETQSKKENIPVANPTTMYQNVQFQNQSLMLNRDPNFLYKQNRLQQQIIRQYHEQFNNEKLGQNDKTGGIIPPENKIKQTNGATDHEENKGNSEKEKQVENVQQEKIEQMEPSNFQKFQNILFGGYGNNKIKASLENEDQHNSIFHDEELHISTSTENYERANGQTRNSRISGGYYEAERAQSDNPRSENLNSTNIMDNFPEIISNQQNHLQQRVNKSNQKIHQGSNDLDIDKKGIESLNFHRKSVGGLINENNSTTNLSESNQLHRSSVKSLNSENFKANHGRFSNKDMFAIQEHLSEAQSLHSASYNKDKGSTQFSRDSQQVGKQEQRNSLNIQQKQSNEIQNSRISSQNQHYKNDQKQTFEQEIDPTNMQIQQNVIASYQDESIQNKQENRFSNISFNIQDQKFRVYNSKPLNLNRMSGFSSSNFKPQKSQSVLTSEQQEEDVKTSKICSSLDANEIDNLENEIAGYMNSLENLNMQSDHLKQRIGNRIENKIIQAVGSPDPQQLMYQQIYSQNPNIYELQQQQALMGQQQQQANLHVPNPNIVNQFQPNIMQNSNPNLMYNQQPQQMINNTIIPQAPQYTIPHLEYKVPSPFLGEPLGPQNQNFQPQSGNQDLDSINKVINSNIIQGPMKYAPLPQIALLKNNTSSGKTSNLMQKYTPHQMMKIEMQIDRLHMLLLAPPSDKPEEQDDVTLDLMKGIEHPCCLDQACSRFVQERLVMLSVNPNEKRNFLDKILRNPDPSLAHYPEMFEELVRDQFANYVIQKVFLMYDIGQDYHEIMLASIKGNVFRYSTDRHACRVIQTCFDVLQDYQKESLLQELLEQGLVKECSFDFNGNHVVQRIVIQMGRLKNSVVFKNFIQEIQRYIVGFCINEYCCRIVQRMFEYCDPSLIEESAWIILQNYNSLSMNEYGIFVLSSILDQGEQLDQIKSSILQNVKGQAAKMSLEKDGSKLVENCIKMINKINDKHKKLSESLYEILDEIINLPMAEEQNINYQQSTCITFSDLLKNGFANYVIKTAFNVSDHQRRQIIIEKVQKLLDQSPELAETSLRHILKHLYKNGISLISSQFSNPNTRQYNNQQFSNQPLLTQPNLPQMQYMVNPSTQTSFYPQQQLQPQPQFTTQLPQNFNVNNQQQQQKPLSLNLNTSFKPSAPSFKPNSGNFKPSAPCFVPTNLVPQAVKQNSTTSNGGSGKVVEVFKQMSLDDLYGDPNNMKVNAAAQYQNGNKNNGKQQRI